MKPKLKRSNNFFFFLNENVIIKRDGIVKLNANFRVEGSWLIHRWNATK